MRTLLIALLFAALAPVVSAQEDKPLTIIVEPLGDSDQGVVARITFRFATPPEVPPETGMFLQGSFLQNGKVIRNFRLPVLPEHREPVKTVQTFTEGEAEIEVRLIMPLEEGMPVIVHKSSEKFTFAKTDKVYIASADDGAEGAFAEGLVPEIAGAVQIRVPRRDVAPNLFIVNVETQPPVARVEFWVDGKKVIARNAPPFTAELDLGKLPKRVEVRAIGYDERGRYVDADAFVVNERETPLEVKITRTVTPDGVSHFKLSIQNPKGTNLQSVTLLAGDKPLQTWTRPPYALDLPSARLAGVEFVRASVIDSTGYEASDLLFMSGDRFIEQIEVNLIELPVAVLDAQGLPISNLEQKNFTVLENGKPQAITNFNFAQNLPLAIGVLLDHSGSMEKRMGEAQKAAIDFFRSIVKKNDRAFIGGFAGDPTRNAPFVGDLSILEAQVNALPKAAGFTALYDAIVTGLYRFRGLQGRKALIIITDGDDTSSRLTFDDMLAYARASRVPLYFVGIGMGWGSGGRMKELSAETGGVAYFIRGTSNLAETYKQIEKELRSQYLLSYHTQTTRNDNAYRAVEVKVDRPDAKVRTIRGYIP